MYVLYVDYLVERTRYLGIIAAAFTEYFAAGNNSICHGKTNNHLMATNDMKRKTR